MNRRTLEEQQKIENGENIKLPEQENGGNQDHHTVDKLR